MSDQNTHPAHEIEMFDPSGNWPNWDGEMEIHETWAERGPLGVVEVNHVTEESPAPEGVETNWSVYGHLKTGGVFWIADFLYEDHDSATFLMYGLERLGTLQAQMAKQIAAMSSTSNKVESGNA